MRRLLGAPGVIWFNFGRLLSVSLLPFSTAWMASIRPDLPPVPVRYEGEIKLGRMVVHLTDAKFRFESAGAAPD